jgi:SAM-dependent methyltransferase
MQTRSANVRLDSYSPGLNDVGLQSARAVVPILLSLIAPDSAIDLGCGPGNWLLALRESGVADVFGVDQNDYGDDLRIGRECFAVANLTAPFQIQRTFGLVICIEVAEHLPPAAAPTLVRSLTALGPVVMFSAAIPLQGGAGHRNEQWPEYWRDLFAAHDFIPIDCLRPRIWENRDVAWWYTQNLLLYVHRAHLAENPRLQAEAAHPPHYPLALVHPTFYLEKMSETARAGLTGGLGHALARMRRGLDAVMRRGSNRH